MDTPGKKQQRSLKSIIQKLDFIKNKATIANKGENMGRKGVSKRKAKKVKPVSNESAAGIASTRPGDSSPVQSLINKKPMPSINNSATSAPAKAKGKNK